MSDNRIIISAGMVVIAIVLAIFFLGKKENSDAARLAKLLPSKQRAAASGGWGNMIYPNIDAIPLLGGIQQGIKGKLKFAAVGQEREIREKAARFTMYIILAGVAFVFAAILFSNSVEGALGMIIGGTYVGVILYDLAIAREEKAALDELMVSLNLVKDEYNASGMMVISINLAADRSSKIASIQLRQIAKAVGGPNPEREISKYYDVAPNDYLRKLAGVSLSVIINGDTKEPNGMSTYIKSVNQIIEELVIEITNRNRLIWATSGFKFIAVFPVLIIDPLRDYVKNNMTMLGSFFDTSMGMYATYLVYLTLIVSFVGTQMAQSIQNGIRSVQQEGKILDWIMKKVPYTRRLMERFAPSGGDTVRASIVKAKNEPLIKGANSGLSINQLYLRKFIWAFVAFMLTCAALMSGSIMDKVHLLDKGAVKYKATTSAEYTQKDRRILESKLLEEYAGSKQSDAEMMESIKVATSGKSYAVADDKGREYAEQVLAKINKYRASGFKWYYLLIASGIGFVAFWLPNLMLSIKGFLRKQELQKEVDGFYSLCMSLSKNPRAMTKSIIEELHRYSSLFEPQLLACLVRFDKGQEAALIRLKEDCGFPAMEQLIERLISSLHKTTIKEAFIDLEGNRQYSLEQRKLAFEKSLERRISISSVLGIAPTVVLLLVYLGVPLLIYLIPLLANTLKVSQTIG